MPSPGRITEWAVPTGAGIRVDTHVQPGTEISPYYDSMIAKLIVHAPDRPSAIALLDRALAKARIGGVRTTVPLVRRILADPTFAAAPVTTRWLEQEFLDMSAQHIDFVDQTLRDGQQSLWGMRMRAYEAAEALPHLDRTGFRVIDLTGAGMFTVLLRSFADDPWATTDFLVKNLPNNTLRSGLRTISVIGFAHTPEVIIDLWVKTMIKHGVPSFWLYDCLFDLPTMKRLVDVISTEGGIPVPAIMYGFTDVHDDDFFARQAAEMATWDGIETIYLEDAAGVLKPERAATLLPAIRKATGTIPLELHCHNTTGLAQFNYIEGLKAGFEILHTCSRPMANGPSLPSTEGMLPILGEMGYTHSLERRGDASGR